MRATCPSDHATTASACSSPPSSWATEGWDDIHLPYLWILKTLSGKTGASLTWSEYHRSVKTIFQAPYDPQNPIIASDGDELDGCTHRFGDALVQAGDHPVTAFNYFTADPLANDCDAEGYDIVLSNFDPVAVTAGNDCAKDPRAVGDVHSLGSQIRRAKGQWELGREHWKIARRRYGEAGSDGKDRHEISLPWPQRPHGPAAALSVAASRPRPPPAPRHIQSAPLPSAAGAERFVEDRLVRRIAQPKVATAPGAPNPIAGE